MLFVKSIISLVQGYAVVINNSTDVDNLMKMFIFFGFIEFEFICSDWHFLKTPSIFLFPLVFDLFVDFAHIA